MLSDVFLGINAMNNVSKSKQNKFANHLVAQEVAEQMVATHMKPWLCYNEVCTRKSAPIQQLCTMCRQGMR